jgi:RecJ-like exonuclease
VIRICSICNGRGKAMHAHGLDVCARCNGTGDMANARGYCDHRLSTAADGVVCVRCRIAVTAEDLLAAGWVRRTGEIQ